MASATPGKGNLPVVQDENLPAQVEQEVEKQVITNFFWAGYAVVKDVVKCLLFPLLGFLPYPWVKRLTNYPDAMKFSAGVIEIIVCIYFLTFAVSGSLLQVVSVICMILSLLRNLFSAIDKSDRPDVSPQFYNTIGFGPVLVDIVGMSAYHLFKVLSEYLSGIYRNTKQTRIQKLIEEKKAKELGQ
jgi:hypothetical protein